MAVVVALFLVGIRLLGSATDALRPFLRTLLARVVVGDRSALGLGWVAAYVLANGSLVAAISVSLFSADLTTTSQTFLLLVGSRLGSAAVVVLVGAIDYLGEEMDSLRESTRLGLLTFLITHSVYLPALVVGYAALPLVDAVEGAGGGLPDSGLRPPQLFATLTDAIVTTVGPGLSLALAVGCIVVSFRLFDRVLDALDKERLRRRYFRELQDKWLSFWLGLVFTALTTSVAFSLGVIVPLYNRGHLKRNEVIPFVLGANIGTLADTLVVAVALETAVGTALVLLLLVLGFVISVALLVAYGTYSRLVATAQERLVGRRRYFVGFLLSLVLVPLALVVL